MDSLSGRQAGLDYHKKQLGTPYPLHGCKTGQHGFNVLSGNTMLQRMSASTSNSIENLLTFSGSWSKGKQPNSMTYIRTPTAHTSALAPL
jgi:hypothetical protein